MDPPSNPWKAPFFHLLLFAFFLFCPLLGLTFYSMELQFMVNSWSIHAKRWENPLEMEIYMGQSSTNGGENPADHICYICSPEGTKKCAPLFKRDMMCTPAILGVSP